MSIEERVARDVRTRLASLPAHLVDVDGVRRRARRTTLRRRVTTGVVAGVVVAGVAWAATTLRPEERTQEPVLPPPVNVDSTRPLTYAEGSAIQYGTRQVDVDAPPDAIEVTDYGVAFMRSDGSIWLSDGGAPEQIGSTEPAWIVDWEVDPLVSQATGPDLEWFEPDGSGGVDAVVYDTRTREEVGRVPTGVDPGCSGECAEIFGAHDGRLYWTDRPCREECRGFPPTHDDESNVEPTPTTRETDLASGDGRLLTSPEFRAVVRAWPRVIELRQASGKPMDETSDDYLVGEGLGLQIGGWPRVEVYGPGPGELVRFVVASGEPVQFRGHGQLPTDDDFRLVQWLDDDRVVLAQYRFNRDFTRVRYSTLVTCQFSTHSCEVTTPAPDGGSRVVPGT
jgi:hypothetical protein